jgi:hypothetical protein
LTTSFCPIIRASDGETVVVAVPTAGLGEGVSDGVDGLIGGAVGEAVGLTVVGAEVAGAADVVLGLASPAGMAQPATSETISAMTKLRTSNRCRGPAISQRRAG